MLLRSLKEQRLKNILQIPNLSPGLSLLISLQNSHGYNLKDNSAVIALKLE